MPHTFFSPTFVCCSPVFFTQRASLCTPPVSDDDDVRQSAPSLAHIQSQSTTLTYVLCLQLLRKSVWELITMEIAQAAHSTRSKNNEDGSGSGGKMDTALESVLLSLCTPDPASPSASGPSPSPACAQYRYLHSYLRLSEDVSAERRCVSLLHDYQLDLPLLLAPPSVEELEEGITKATLYNINAITNIMQIDLDGEFEREETEQQRHQQHLDSSMGELDTSTDSKLLIAASDSSSSRVSTAIHRSRIEHLVLSLHHVHHCLLLADVELDVLHAWRAFAHMCINTRPQLLWVRQDGEMAMTATTWTLIQHTSAALDRERRVGEGVLVMGYLHELSSLLLTLLNAAINMSDGGDGLASSILLALSSSYGQKQRDGSDGDVSRDGVTVFTALHPIMALLTHKLQANIKMLSNTHHAQSMRSNNAHASTLFDITGNISDIMLTDRSHWRMMPGSNVDVRSSSSHDEPSIAATHVRSLIACMLLVSNYTNGVLLRELARGSESKESPPLLPPPALNGADGGGGGGDGVISPMRRLDGSILSPTSDSLDRSIHRHAPSLPFQSLVNEYGRICQQMVHSLTLAVRHDALADGSITLIPIIMRSIDLIQSAQQHQQGKQKRSNTDDDTSDGATNESTGRVDAALTTLRGVIPHLLHTFSSLRTHQASTALRLIQLFCSMAQYESGAEMLVQHSIVLCIMRHPILDPAQAGRHSYPASSSAPSFAPYTHNLVRDAWHEVWVECLHLLSTILRTLGRRARFGASLTFNTGYDGSGSAALGLTPTLSKLIENMLAFINLFSPHRINHALHATQLAHLSIGGLAEVRALTRLIYEYEQYGRYWHHANPALHQRQRQQVILTLAYYMRLLNDPRELERRIVLVTSEEKMMGEEAENAANAATDGDGGGDGAATATTRPAAAGGESMERQVSAHGGVSSSIDEKKGMEGVKKAWRPLGGGAAGRGLGSGASTPHHLSTPTTPRSATTPVQHSQTPSQDERERRGSDAYTYAYGRRQLSTPVPLTPMRGNTSFLVRSPFMHAQANADGEGSGSVMIGTGSLTAGAHLPGQENVHRQAQQGMAFVTQQIEYSICLVLQNCASYVRMQTSRAARSRSMKRLLFNHRIRVVNTGVHAPSIYPLSFLSGSGLARLTGRTSAFSSDGSAHTGLPLPCLSLPTRDQLQQLFAGLGLDIDEEATYSQEEQEVERMIWETEEGAEDAVDSYDAAVTGSKSTTPYIFRPPLSILIDFEQYCCKILTRLYEIQRSSGNLAALCDPATVFSSMDHSLDLTTFLPGFKQLRTAIAMEQIHTQIHGVDSMAHPTIASIHHIIAFLQETMLYVLHEHVHMHIHRLKQVQEECMSNSSMAMMSMMPSSSVGVVGSSFILPPDPMLHASQHGRAVPPAAFRIGKHLEQYASRLHALADLLARYCHLINTGVAEASRPSPPPITPDDQLQAEAIARALNNIQPSRLVIHMRQGLAETAQALAKHTNAFHRMAHQMQHALQMHRP